MTRTGRPRASSRDTLAEAACELFLEQGYQSTSAADIARRAGVSRSSFFNYFPAKDDVFWAGFDAHVATLPDALAAGAPGESGARSTLLALVDRLTPDALALGFANAVAMGIEGDLRRGAAIRQADVAAMLGDHLAAHDGRPGAAEEAKLHSAVRAAALAAALLVAVRMWATAGPGRTSLSRTLQRAFASVGEI